MHCSSFVFVFWYLLCSCSCVDYAAMSVLLFFGCCLNFKRRHWFLSSAMGTGLRDVLCFMLAATFQQHENLDVAKYR